MHNNVRKYFEDFESMNFKRKNEAILFTDHAIKLVDRHNSISPAYSNVRSFIIDGIPVVVKDWQDEISLYSLATSQMYDDIGIVTPPEYIIRHEQPHIGKIKVAHHSKDYTNLFCTFAQNISSVRKISPELAIRIKEYKKVVANCGNKNYKWSILTEPALRHKFLEFMTEKCLDELMTLHLVDELRTEVDRHMGNLFLYKTKGSDKYDGVIAIDNGFGQIAQNKDISFQDLLMFTYGSHTPQDGVGTTSYPNRIDEIRNLLYNGYIKKTQSKFLRKALKYDFPGTIKSVCKKYKIKGTKYNKTLYDKTARLWEYNQETIGRDLGL
jgi:hypothetical protein